MNDVRTLGSTTSLPEPPAGWFDYGYAVLADGTLALLRADIDVHAERARWQARPQGGEAHAPPRLRDGRARVSTFDGSTESKAIEVPLGAAPIVDRLADGRWLVAARHAAQGEHNARLYAADGAPAGAFAMGGGITHIGCATDGTIWARYFDEAIFSGPGEDGRWPISSSGIARFAPDGAVLWEFNAAVGADLFIADCYAMALEGNRLWCCSYVDFPIVRVEDGTVRHWQNEIRGASALAIDAGHVLLAGGYGNEAGRIALLSLDDGNARHLGELRFQPPPRGTAAVVQGQGSTLHIVGQGHWTRLNVATVRAALQG